MALAQDISLATIPVIQGTQSLSRINRAYLTGTASGSTLLLSTAPAVLSVLGVANVKYQAATIAMGSYAFSLADKAIAGRGLDIARMSGGELIDTATDITKMAASSGLVGGTAQRVMAAAVQAKTAIDNAYRAYKAIGGIDGIKKIVLPSGSLQKPGGTPNPDAASARPHLLIMKGDAETFYFGLDTAAFTTLLRDSGYNIAALERLGRRQSLQFVAINAETIRLEGVVFGSWKGGIGQFEKLRNMALTMRPVNLTTGYGLVLGRWYIMRIEEGQEALMQDGAPRKQNFSIELSRYGEDYQKL